MYRHRHTLNRRVRMPVTRFRGLQQAREMHGKALASFSASVFIRSFYIVARFLALILALCTCMLACECVCFYTNDDITCPRLCCVVRARIIAVIDAPTPA